ncbi:MAG: site-2 protease family protein [Fervidicoccaceae archaeon]
MLFVALLWASIFLIARFLSSRVRGLVVKPLYIMYRLESTLSFLDSFAASRAASAYLALSPALFVASAALFYYFVARVSLATLSGAPSAGGLVPVIPGLTIRGLVALHVLISIGLAALVHEVAHAVALKRFGVKIKSSGLLLAVVIPAAFVEPDERELTQRGLKQRTLVYSAGPASNLALALALLLALSFIGGQAAGVEVLEVSEGGPAQRAGVQPGFVILEINGTPIRTVEDLQRTVSFYRGCDVILELRGKTLRGEEALYVIHKRADEDLIGVTVRQAKAWNLPDELYYPTVDFLFYCYVINLSLAMINAAPLFVTDGGRVTRDLLVRALGERAGGTLSFFVQALTLLMVLTSIRLSPL